MIMKPGRPETNQRPTRGLAVRTMDGHRVFVDMETSLRMGGVRQCDTSAEQLVRRLLYRLGARYRTGVRNLPGSPDLANRSRRWALFVHGCFWHRHAGCVRATTPKRNTAFWLAKFAANRARDMRAVRALRRLGYEVTVVWECQTFEPEKLVRRLRRELAVALTNPPEKLERTGRVSGSHSQR